MTELAYFGCGCFWTKEYLFGKLHGVVGTRTGYMGGDLAHPTYHQVCTKLTGHAEVVEVRFDPKETSLVELLKGFFSFHDATKDRSSKGGQYRSVVFWRKLEEKEALESILATLEAGGCPVSTTIEAAGQFWEAEPRHQGYVQRTGRHCDLVPAVDLQSLSILDIVRRMAS